MEMEILKSRHTLSFVLIGTLAFLLIFLPPYSMASDNGFLVLCYHSIPPRLNPKDPYGVSQSTFVRQMEYLKVHGYTPVSVEQIIRAANGIEPLPAKAVLLTFDDAYESYYKFVFPLLKLFGYPSVLGVVGSWIENPPRDLPEPLMSWQQIKEVSSSPLVEIASHTFDLHKGIRYTRQGNIGPSIWVKAYDPDTKRYELPEQYRERLAKDFEKQEVLFKQKLGVAPRVLAWPYGKFNSIALELAKSYGFKICLTLEEGRTNLSRLHYTNRMLVKEELAPRVDPILHFKNLLSGKGHPPHLRAVQVDLDLIYDPSSPQQTDENLGMLIDRLVAMKVNTVFLQAFADPDGDGNVDSVYFPNRVLPVRADILGWATHQIKIRDIDVFAWMPTLSFTFPDHSFNNRFRTRQFDGEQVSISTSWYKRLTPFSKEVEQKISMLYEDLASHCMIDGILFQDDAYLSDSEDFHPLAIKDFHAALGKEPPLQQIEKEAWLRERWTRHKTMKLIDFTNLLKNAVVKFRPNSKFARNIYAPLLCDPAEEIHFAQHYELFLRNYDWVVVMAYPQMEKAREPMAWLRDLVASAKKSVEGLEKTVFKIQTYNWEKNKPIPAPYLLQELRAILSAGGRHLAYYPDNCFEDQPRLKTIKLEMSTEDYPFLQ